MGRQRLVGFWIEVCHYAGTNSTEDDRILEGDLSGCGNEFDRTTEKGKGVSPAR